MRRVAVLLCLWWLVAAPSWAEVRHLVILHTNDFHGHLEPFTDKDLVPPPGQVGGAAYLAGEIESLHHRYPHSLLLDAGDIAQGTPVSNLFFGEPDVDFFNALPYDARTIGNHEFDWGLDKLEHVMIDPSKAPIVCANLVLRQGGGLLPKVRPYIVKRVDGLRVGILGLVTPDTPKFSFPDNVAAVQFLDPATVVRQYLPSMRKDGAQLIVLLTHLGVDVDEKLARDVPGIDVIIGGHSHTPLHDPVVVGNTVITQAGCYGRYVGRLEVDYDTDRHEVVGHTEHDELITIVTSDIKPDAGVAAMVERFKTRVGDILNRVVGTLAADLPAGRGATGDTPLGDVVTDALRAQTGADVAVYNHGGLRGSLVAGTVHWSDVFTVLPFDNHVVTVALTGQQLLHLLGQGVAPHAMQPLQVSGLSYVADIENHTVSDVEVGGAPLDPTRTYQVASVDFLYEGGDGFTGLKVGGPPRYGPLARDVFSDYLKQHPGLAPPPSGRLKVLAAVP